MTSPMSDQEFEREVRAAAHRVAAGYAPEALHARVAAVSADGPRFAPAGRFESALRYAFAAVVVVAVVGAGAIAVASRTQVPTAAPGNSSSVAVTGSPAPTPSPSSSPSAVALVTRDLGGVSITMPADWQVLSPKVWIMPMGPTLFLSNAPIADPCPTEFAKGDACRKPLVELPPNGIVVTMGGSAVPGLKYAVIVRRVDQTCSEMGGERELGAAFLGLVASACLRGPDLASSEEMFRQMVASMKRN
jgi:hypothetical protein